MDVFKERKEQQENELKAKLAKLRGPKTNLPDIPGDAKSVVPYAPEKAPLQLLESKQGTDELARQLQATRAERDELREKVNYNKVAVENLVEQLQDVRNERDEARDKAKKLQEMLSVMEELQEELTSSVDPTMKTLTNLRAVIKSQEEELEAKDKEIIRLRETSKGGNHQSLCQENALLQTQITELVDKTISQAAKIQEYKQIMTKDLLSAATGAEASKKGLLSIADVDKGDGDKTEVKEIAAELAALGDDQEKKELVIAAELATLRKELEDERSTRKQLAATLMSMMAYMEPE